MTKTPKRPKAVILQDKFEVAKLSLERICRGFGGPSTDASAKQPVALGDSQRSGDDAHPAQHWVGFLEAEGDEMGMSRHPEAQIIAALKQVLPGRS